MHLKLCFLSLALFLSGSLAKMCYECENEPGGDTACADGNFYRNALPSSVKLTDCEEGGCQKMVMVMKDLGITMYKRGCADPIFKEIKCIDPQLNIDFAKIFGALPMSLNMDVDQTICVCKDDYCNGAGRLNSRQALMGVIAAVLTIVLMQH